MTFEEAAKALGYEEPPEWMEQLSRDVLVETAEDLSAKGTKPIDPEQAYLVRMEAEMFA